MLISDPMESLKFRDILVDKSRMDKFYNLTKSMLLQLMITLPNTEDLEETRLLPKKPDGEPYLFMFADNESRTYC